MGDLGRALVALAALAGAMAAGVAVAWGVWAVIVWL
jgi:hypothetical protein